MPPIRIYLMHPLGPAGPWQVSVNGSEGDSFKEEESAVRAARDMAHELGREGQVVEVRQETPDGQWGQGLALSAALQAGSFRSERENGRTLFSPPMPRKRSSPNAARSSSATCSKPAP